MESLVYIYTFNHLIGGVDCDTKTMDIIVSRCEGMKTCGVMNVYTQTENKFVNSFVTTKL